LSFFVKLGCTVPYFPQQNVNKVKIVGFFKNNVLKEFFEHKIDVENPMKNILYGLG